MATRPSGFPLILSAPITGGGNRPNSTGVSAQLDGDPSPNDKINKWFDTSAITLTDVRGPGVPRRKINVTKLQVAVKLAF